MSKLSPVHVSDSLVCRSYGCEQALACVITARERFLSEVRTLCMVFLQLLYCPLHLLSSPLCSCDSYHTILREPVDFSHLCFRLVASCSCSHMISCLPSLCLVYQPYVVGAQSFAPYYCSWLHASLIGTSCTCLSLVLVPSYDICTHSDISNTPSRVDPLIIIVISVQAVACPLAILITPY